MVYKKRRRREALPRWLIEESHRSFWRDSAINEVESFRAHAASRSPIYVAIDCEGDENTGGVHSIGICILTSSPAGHGQVTSHSVMDFSLDDIVSHNSITTKSIWIAGRSQESDKRSKRRTCEAEQFRYGVRTMIPLESLQDHLTKILTSVRLEHPFRPLHLIGWGIAQEIRAFIALCPFILSFFAHWTDVGIIAARMSGILGARQRSLRDVMLALGFSREDGYTLQHFLSFTKRHDPGMDALRTMATMLKLLAWPEAERLDVPRETRKEVKERKLLHRRPDRAKYPCAVRIGVKNGKKERLPESLHGFEKLANFVHDVIRKEPICVTLCSRASGKYWGRTHAWVCLEEHADMLKLVEEVDGRKVDSVELEARLDTPLDGIIAQRRQRDLIAKRKQMETPMPSIRVKYDQVIMDEMTPMLAWE